MTGLDRYGTDTRALLDMVAHELFRFDLPRGAYIHVDSHYCDLLEDLEDRLQGYFTLTTDKKLADVTVFLFSLELESDCRIFEELEDVIIAFRNTFSHKSVLYPRYEGLRFFELEKRSRKAFATTSATGIMPPGRLLWLLAAALANRFGRYDFGFHFSDRALLSPLCKGWERTVCPLGVLACRKDHA